MPSVVLEKYFGDGHFTIEAVYELSPELCRKLGFPGAQLVLPPGIYGFRETNVGISLNLRLAGAGADSSPLLAGAC